MAGAKNAGYGWIERRIPPTEAGADVRPPRGALSRGPSRAAPLRCTRGLALPAQPPTPPAGPRRGGSPCHPSYGPLGHHDRGLELGREGVDWEVEPRGPWPWIRPRGSSPASAARAIGEDLPPPEIYRTEALVPSPRLGSARPRAGRDAPRPQRMWWRSSFPRSTRPATHPRHRRRWRGQKPQLRRRCCRTWRSMISPSRNDHRCLTSARLRSSGLTVGGPGGPPVSGMTGGWCTAPPPGRSRQPTTVGGSASPGGIHRRAGRCRGRSYVTPRCRTP